MHDACDCVLDAEYCRGAKSVGPYEYASASDAAVPDM